MSSPFTVLDAARQTALHFLLSLLFPHDPELKACWPISADKARQREFQRVAFRRLEEARSVPGQLRNKTVLNSSLLSERHHQLLGYLSTLALRTRLERDAQQGQQGTLSEQGAGMDGGSEAQVQAQAGILATLSAFQHDRALELTHPRHAPPAHALHALTQAIEVLQD